MELPWNTSCVARIFRRVAEDPAEEEEARDEEVERDDLGGG